MELEQKINILLVDDHPENLLALEAILGSLGQNLVKAHSGVEALKCLLNQDFAVILLDVQMPGMDGFETATLIRERERSRHTPIIFLTAFSTSDTLVFKGYSLGAVDYLIKPIEPEILKSKLAVFVDLFKKTAEVKRQAAQLAAINAELGESEQRFRSLSACSPVGIFLTDIAGCCTYTNSHCQATYNFILNESLLEGWSRSLHPEDRDWVLADWSALTQEGRQYSEEFRLLTQEETVRWVHVRSYPLLSDQGELLGHVGTVEDITERKRAESEIKTSLQEKEVLLKEVHHRVKNNLQIIDSLFRHQCRHSKDQRTTEILKECQNRVNSMALVHEKLYQSKDLSKINFAGYIRSLLANLFDSYSINASLITLKIDIDGIFLDIETALPCGLIVNELVSNSLKYAFPASKKGKIQISCYSTDAQDFLLNIKDDGIGLPEDFDLQKSQSLGLKLVRSLVKQLGGIIAVNHSRGTEFLINFTGVKGNANK